MHVFDIYKLHGEAMSRKIQDNVYSVGVDDRTSHTFEALWPIPEGISYNSYLLDDSKVVLFDTVKDIKFSQFLGNITEAIGDKKIDYLVVHHLEPDHCGSIEMLKKYYPEMKVIGNSKTVEFLEHIFPGLEDVEQVEDGQELSTGSHTLIFYKTPMIHWPETMMTYEAKTGCLFSGDAFGSFRANNGALFDGRNDLDKYEDDLLRYYSNIVGKYSSMVSKALGKLGELEINTICPAHGTIWKDNPEWIINKYKKWSSQEGEKGVVIAYGSMYGNTERMISLLSEMLYEKGVEAVKVHNISETHSSYIVRDIWRYKGLVLAAPTYDTKVFPLMANLLNLLTGKMVKNKVVGIMGTYGWSGGGVDGIKDFVEQARLELAEPVIEARFNAKAEQIEQCRELAANLASKLG